MVNRGEEKVRVHMNVVPRSTINTNGGTEKGTPSVNCRSEHSVIDVVIKSSLLSNCSS